MKNLQRTGWLNGLLKQSVSISEVIMNLVVVLLMWHLKYSWNYAWFCCIYALLIPMIFALIKFAPTIEVAHVRIKKVSQMAGRVFLGLIKLLVDRCLTQV